jgi:DNA-binding response OmpR family regulator
MSFVDSILVIEDDPRIAAVVADALRETARSVRRAGSAAEGLAAIRETPPELIVLDLGLPDLSGASVCRKLREETRVPIVVLTARHGERETVQVLNAGADDYVTKPFGLMELLARIDALLRRATRPNGESPRVTSESPSGFGDVRVDAARHMVTRRGTPVPLRPKEYDLLVALLRRNGQVATRIELLKEVWGYDDSVMSRTVDTHIAELRRKLESDPANPRHILTVLKTGYRLSRE